MEPQRKNIGNPDPNDPVISIPAASFGPGEGDCIRVAFAIAYAIPYEDLPDNNTLGVYGEWARERGYYLWGSAEAAPIDLHRWVASVDGMTAGEPHAVAMCRKSLLLDPASLGDGAAYEEIKPRDVRFALALLPQDQRELSGNFWPITRPFSQHTTDGKGLT